MKSISLTENEIAHIREMYSQELERLQKRAIEINAILQKFQGKESIDEQVIEKTPKKIKNKAVEKLPKAIKTAKIEEAIIASVIEKPKARRGRPAKQKAEVKTVSLQPESSITAVPKATRGRKPKNSEIPKIQPVIAEKETRTAKKAKAEKLAKPAKVKKEVVKLAKAAKLVKPAKVKKDVVKLAKPAKVKKEVVKSTTPAKKGRKKSEPAKKSSWTASILEILEKTGKVLSSHDIIDQIMTLQKISATNRPKTRSIVTGSLSDLKLETKRVKSVSVPGQKGELYGLSQWYDDAGNLIDQYKN